MAGTVLNMEMQNREVMNNWFYNYKTGSPFLYADYANVSTVDYKTTRVFGRGGQGGARRFAFDGQPEPSLKFETQSITPQLIAMLSGSDIVSGSTNVYKHITLTSVTASTTTTLTLTDTPVADTLYVYPAGGIISDANKVAGTLSTTTFTFTTKATTDGPYDCFYQVAGGANDEVVTFKANKFPAEFVWVGEAPWTADDGSIISEQIKAYRCKPQQNFTMTYQNTGDPGTFSITFDLLSDSNKNILDKHFIYT